MLQHLTIRNLAIVQEAELAFKKGMTVITGETGAGKSILLDALNLVLGHRADIDLIQPGQEKAEVTAIFDVSHLPGAVLWLTDLELNSEEAESCILRRTIYQNGRSRAYINGIPTTTQQLRLLGEYLVQMHGQHKHQILLQPREQLRVLDVYGKHLNEVNALKVIYYKIEKLLNRKQKITSADSSSEYQIELLQYQIEEIDTLQLLPNEVQKLYQEHDQLAHADHTLQACQTAIESLDNEECGNALQLIHQAKHSLSNLFDKYAALNNVKECLEGACIQLNETVSELSHFMDNLEINPERLNDIMQRLERIHDIARKHKIEAEQLYAYHETLKAKLSLLLEQNQSVDEVDAQIEVLTKEYLKIAKQLRQKRKQTAKKLEDEITKHIQTLAMQGAEFKVLCEPTAESNGLGPTGLDEVTFCISANIGHPPKPIHKVASGGELSRISLALELTTLKDLPSPTLIFDEVDVGIGGKTGAIVGQCLHTLSHNQQVICITHLPQVAAFGDQHLFVSKMKKNNQSQTTVNELTAEERVDEIARMLGGIDIGAEARAQAKHLLKQEKQPVGV